MLKQWMADVACDGNAVRFQRVTQGALLLIAVQFQWMPLAVFVLAVMIVGILLSFRCAMFALLYVALIRPALKSSPPSSSCGCPIDSKEERFACTLGFLFVASGVWLHYQFAWPVLPWVLIGLTGALSLLAGTTGFCVGSALYSVVRTALKKKTP